MATKNRTDVGERSNRFRFVMLEADLSDSNVNALANAIVSALRAEAPSPAKRLPAPPSVTPRLGPPAVASGNGAGESQEQEASDDGNAATAPEMDDEVASAAPPTGTTRARKPTKPAQPTFVNTLFATSADADEFKAFVSRHPTKKHSERYLVSALYLRDHGTNVVNMDMVYTCYRVVGWPMTLSDWDVNLRNQLRNDRFRRAEGGYVLTTAGENVVQELRAASAS